jgi:hypothetical protein
MVLEQIAGVLSVSTRKASTRQISAGTVELMT